MFLPSLERGGRNSIHSIWAIILIFTFQVRFIILETSMEVNDSKAALLIELSGTHLLISAYPDPPWLNERVGTNGTFTYYGFHVNIVDYLAEALNFTYSFVRLREDEVKKIGRKDASFNNLIRKEVNITTVLVFLSLYECSRADCTVPLIMAKNKLMVPWPDEESRIIAPLKPFQLEVWILLAVSVVFATLAFTYLPKLYKEKNNQSQDLGTSAIYVLTGEGGCDWNQWKSKLSFRILQGIWCLAAFVLLNAYSSTIISYLTAPKLMPVAKSLEDVVHGIPKHLKLLVEKDLVTAAKYLNSTTKHDKLIGDHLRRYPENLFLSGLEGFNKLFTGEYAYASIEARVSVYMDMAYKKANNTCRFTISNQNISPHTPLSLTFAKHWRYTDVANNKLRRLTESGLPYYWRDKIIPRVEKCQLENYEVASAEKRVLTLRDMMGPFIFLLAGISVSFLVFLIEMIVFKYRTNIINT